MVGSPKYGSLRDQLQVNRAHVLQKLSRKTRKFKGADMLQNTQGPAMHSQR